MLFPYSTDAPIYHLPFATGAMIATNVATFFIISSLPEETACLFYSEGILVYGQGLRPWQWITSNFLHSGFLHLLGNMLCLWGFGLVVEGKVGWWRFLLIFFGIGILQCAIEQTLMLSSDSRGSLGASSIVYGLLAIAMIWAPQNEMRCVLIILIRPFSFEARLSVLAGFSILLELGIGILGGLKLSSQILHLMGIGAGLGIGVLMLKKGWVDCEGWDVFSIWQGRKTTDRDDQEEAAAKALLDNAYRKRVAAAGSHGQRRTNKVRPHQPPPESNHGTTLDSQSDLHSDFASARQAIAGHNPKLAFAKLETVARRQSGWASLERELFQVVILFHAQKQWSASIPATVKYLQHFSFGPHGVAIRIRLAQILIDVEKRPRQALVLMDPLKAKSLSEKERQTVDLLRAKAKKLALTVREETIPEKGRG